MEKKKTKIVLVNKPINAVLIIALFLMPFFIKSQSVYVINENSGLMYFKDSLKFEREIIKTITAYHKQGYITSNVVYKKSNDSLIGNIYKGSQYLWGEIRWSSEFDKDLRRVGVSEKDFLNRKISVTSYLSKVNLILDYYENNGFPFASVSFDSVTINNNLLYAKLNISAGPEVKVDTVIIKGGTTLNPKILSAFLNIKKGDLYDESVLKQAKDVLNQTGLVTCSKNPEVVFNEKGAKIYLFVNDQKNSSINGIIGFQPQEGDEKLTITGDVDLKLLSAFKYGEEIRLKWRSFPYQSQDLQLGVFVPFLFNTPLGVKGEFSLYKQDTTFINLNPKLNLSYYLTHGNFISATIENNTSNLISTKQYQAVTQVPENNNTSSNLFGITGDFKKLDYLYNPRKGFGSFVSVSVGTKKIKPINGVSTEIYDSINLNSTIAKLEWDFYSFIPVGKKITNYIQYTGKLLENENLFQNELFRIGGYQSLRGFDEMSILASSFHIFNYELRYLFDENSNFFIFGNVAYTESKSYSNPITSDWPYGFGAGLNLSTEVGVFGLVYALGAQQNNPLLFKTAKIHFGYAARF